MAATSPIFNYPYERSRAALEMMKRSNEWDPYHGLKMRYVNPVDGGWAMPTIGTCLQLLPKDFKTLPYRSTDATVFVGVEGSGYPPSMAKPSVGGRAMCSWCRAGITSPMKQTKTQCCFLIPTDLYKKNAASGAKNAVIKSGVSAVAMKVMLR